MIDTQSVLSDLAKAHCPADCPAHCQAHRWYLYYIIAMQNLAVVHVKQSQK